MLPVIEIALPVQPGGNVPAFLAKLWKMVDNPDADNLISWSDDGSSFTIRNQGEFTKTLLPYYYKHSNMASFVRQLNMYGFHKVMSVESGGLKGDKDEVEFAHPFFLRGQEHLLDQIKRKITAGNRGGAGITPFVPSIKSEKVNEVLSEVGVLKERQEDLDNKLENMRSENEALWGEVLSLRQKHNQQQKIVNKLIQFLVALVQPRISKGIKRKFRHPSFPSHKLAIEEDSTTPCPKEAKVEEIAEEIEDCHLSNILDNNDNEAKSKYTMVDPASVTPSLRQLKIEKLSQDLSPSKILSKAPEPEYDSEDMQAELDSLKDILAGSGQITLDTSFMSGLMNGDSSDVLSGMKFFTDSVLSAAEEDNLHSPPPSEAYHNDLKFLTYDSDSTMKSSILALAAESSGINLDEELLSTPPRSAFDVDMDFN